MHGALPVPQTHCPAVHVSARSMSHAVHAWPPVPHAVGDAVSQVAPVQQPSGHTQLLQTPPLQLSPVGHTVHPCPPVPQAFAAVPDSHEPPLQQPLGHDSESQRQLPAAQCCIGAHAEPDPQLQPPFASHPSLVMALQPTHTHAPDTHSRPGGQGGPPAQAGPSCR
jgi:hypothetical protein